MKCGRHCVSDWAANRVLVVTQAVFMLIGAKPHTDWLSGAVETDRDGRVRTDPALSAGAFGPQSRQPFFLGASQVAFLRPQFRHRFRCVSCAQI
jgi:hypothetical protein